MQSRRTFLRHTLLPARQGLELQFYVQHSDDLDHTRKKRSGIGYDGGFHRGSVVGGIKFLIGRKLRLLNTKSSTQNSAE